MSKTVLKLRHNDYWRIGEHESWFTDMAARGLHLKKTGLIFAKFEKGEPEEIRYRIEVTKDKLTEEQKSLYKEYGWEFVAKYGKFNVFSSPEALGAPELHTDSAEQSYTLKALDEGYRQSVVMMSIVMALFIVLMLTMFIPINTPFLAMIEGQILNECLFVVINLYSFYSIIRASSAIRALRKSLSEGTPIDHHANWRKNRWVSYSVGMSFILVAVLTLGIPIITLNKMESYTLPVGEANLPIVRLAEIENNPNLARKSPYMNDDIDRRNILDYYWSPLAPIHYEVKEQGIVPSDMWKDGSGKYTPSISAEYYELIFAGMADGLVNDLMKNKLYQEDEEIQNISHPDFDKLYIVENKETKQIFASIGENVVYIRYHGYADIDRIIALASEKLSLESRRQ